MEQPLLMRDRTIPLVIYWRTFLLRCEVCKRYLRMWLILVSSQTPLKAVLNYSPCEVCKRYLRMWFSVSPDPSPSSVEGRSWDKARVFGYYDCVIALLCKFYEYNEKKIHADEAWYWPKRILHSGWLYMTSRSNFKRDVVHWLSM